jgi:glycosyltransferase involved in cell wall biosynthesis
LDVLRRSWDVVALGLNYNGDPHRWPYPIFPTGPDGFGLERLPAMVDGAKPDLIVIQNDPWNFPEYFNRLGERLNDIPVVGAVAVDGLNCRGEGMNPLSHAIFWTQFGFDQARIGGFTRPATVIPLGVDLDIYRPMDKMEARRELVLPKLPDDAFIVTFVGRNQPRKRLDLLIDYFASWVKTKGRENAWLYLHVAPTGDKGYGISNLMHYHLPLAQYGRRLLWLSPEVYHGASEEWMRLTYCASDVGVTCSQNEGFNLPMIESMACGIPQVAPDWAAHSSTGWPGEALRKVDCTTFAATIGGANAIGGIPDKDDFIRALDHLYTLPNLRETLRERGLAKVAEPQFRWENIGLAWAKVLDGVMAEREKAAEVEVLEPY